MMRCKVLLAVIAVLGTVTAIPMTLNDFSPFQHKCFNGSSLFSLHVNGQNYPLANTLENFINLVEKLEWANPDMKLEQEVYFLLNDFTLDNLFYGDDSFTITKPNNLNSDTIKKLWQFGRTDIQTSGINIPFTDDEFCSLFTMLSHSINSTDAQYEKPQTGNRNGPVIANTGDSLMMADPNIEPARESGVVSVMGTNQTVAIGRVVTGIYLALQDLQNKKLSEVAGSDRFNSFDPDLKSRDPDVVPLYLLTVIEPLVSSLVAPSGPKGLYPDGQWKYVKNTMPADYEVPDICHTVYEVPRESGSLYSFSSVRGGYDGAFLGNVISGDKNSFKDRKLGEVLRQYYSYPGVQSPIEPLKRASLCRRLKFATDNQDYFLNMTEVYYALGFPEDASRRPKLISNARDELVNKQEKIFDLQDVLKRYCESEKPSVVRTESCENPNDVIIVLDVTKTEYLEKQQQIVGYLANMMDMWQNGTSAIVIADQESEESNDLMYMPVTSSTACLACQITQRNKGSSSEVPFDKVIDFVSEILETKKKEQHQMNGAPGKVVIFFKYTEESNKREVENAMIKLRTNHMEAQILGVGKDENIVNMITGGVKFNTIMTGVGDNEAVAKTLASRVCTTPAALQYEFCRDGALEAESVYRGLVSTNSKQYWRMDPKYFEKSLSNMYFKVSATGGGDIQVCHNKASEPDTAPSNCEVLPVGGSKTFSHPNPCNGLTRKSCPSLVFSIHGLENKTDTDSKQFCKPRDATEREASLPCKKLDQISFEISHEGVRCNGCSSMYSAPILLAFAFIFHSVLNRIH